jgi:pyruvate dehydrogenase E2 component (dihydrolipoamide acetyltransferase)
MSLEIRMPQIASDMTEADVVSWLVSPGDRVEQGEILLEIETEKSTVEVEAPASGTLREILVPAGTTEVAVGTLLARLEADESPATDEAARQEPPPQQAPRGARPEPPHPPTQAPRDAQSPADTMLEAATPGSSDVSATALARRVADQAGVDLADVAGTGPHGRITRSDVEQRIAGGPETARGRAASPSSPAERAPAPAGAVAELTARCRIDALLAVRDRLNGSGLDVEVSLADLVVRALALALRDVPEANAARDGHVVARRTTVDLAIGVSAERDIVAPVLRRADEMGLAALSADRRRLIERARAGDLSEDERDASCLAVLDVGIEGIDGVLPALVAPRAGILGIGAARAEPVVEDGRIVAGTTLRLSLRTAADVSPLEMIA